MLCWPRGLSAGGVNSRDTCGAPISPGRLIRNVPDLPLLSDIEGEESVALFNSSVSLGRPWQARWTEGQSWLPSPSP